MKPLIVGLAITVLFSIFLVYQQDNNMYIRQLESLKYAADEAAASGALFYEVEEYSEGKMVYKKNESLKAIDYMIKDSLKLDDSLNPIFNSYWQDTIEYYVYFFDDSGIIKKYKNTTYIGEDTFTYSYLFTDPKADYKKLISEPTIIVTIDAHKPPFRLSFINPNNAIRSSGYEYQGR